MTAKASQPLASHQGRLRLDFVFFFFVGGKHRGKPAAFRGEKSLKGNRILKLTGAGWEWMGCWMGCWLLG